MGSVTACETLAAFLDHGNLVPTDLQRAVHLYERACTLQNVNACSHLGHLYRDGRGVPKDATLARKYRQLACGLAGSLTRDTFCEWDHRETPQGTPLGSQ
jgi:TPR repeat protein